MNGVQLRAGTSSRASWDDGSGGKVDVPSASIMLTHLPGATQSWRLSIEVATANWRAPLGTVLVPPPAVGSPKTRVVAIAGCPGARTWHIDAEAVQPLSVPRETAWLDVSASRCCGQWGIVGIAGQVQAPDEAGVFSYLAGVDGNVNVPVGAKVLSWSVFTSLANATVTIDAGAAIPVPQGGTLSGNPDRVLRGPATFVFTNTEGYFIELVV